MSMPVRRRRQASTMTSPQTIRRTQSIDIQTGAHSRLDSIFRSRPALGVSPIGTRRSLDREIPAIRPSLSCPAAMLESPLPPLSDLHNALEVSAIEFDDDDSVILAAQLAAAPNGDDESLSRNLNNAFDRLVSQRPVMIPIENISVPRISLPEFHLAPALTVSLSTPLVSRVSFYSVVRDINAEASSCLSTDPLGREVVAGDGRIHVHPSPEEESKSILLGKGCRFSNSLLDEEWFLLSAIASRSIEEVESNSDQLLPTFAEAMGETVEESTGSRTQLWKPGRSWWEAKSGKNPWVEPVVHNNRWRYLWPLIHYHKFIAKCIKKLKRNGIDVKTSTSTVSIFLRQEVCHVSDHLAFMSKYDSEEWTNALRDFNGWTDHDPEVETTIRNLVMCQRLVSDDPSDVNSSLLQSQLDQTVLKAMQAVKEEAAAKAATSDNYSYGKGQCGGQTLQSTHEEDGASQNSSRNGEFHPHDRSIRKSWSGSTSSTQSVTKGSKRRGYQGSWRQEYPPSYHTQGIYGPQYAHPLHYNHPYGPTIEPGYYHHYPPPPHYPYMGYHHSPDVPDHHSQYHGHAPYYNGYYGGSFHDGMMLDNSMHSESYVHPSAMATPTRYHGDPPPYQMSPFHHDYWGHLNISQLPGLVPSPNTSMHTPSKPPRSNSNKSFRKRQGQGKNPPIDGNAKSLIIYPKQANSPASRFVMSPQDKSNPYYSARNFQSSNLNQSSQEESFVLPTIEDFSHGSPMKPANSSGHMKLDMAPVSKAFYTESRNDSIEDQSCDD